MPLPEKDNMRQMGFGSDTTIAGPDIDFNSLLRGLPERNNMRQMGFGSDTTIAVPEVNFEPTSRFQNQRRPPQHFEHHAEPTPVFTPYQRTNFDEIYGARGHAPAPAAPAPARYTPSNAAHGALGAMNPAPAQPQAPVQYTSPAPAPAPAPARCTPSAAASAPSQYTLPALAPAPAPVQYTSPAPAQARYTSPAATQGALGAMNRAPAPARYTPLATAQGALGAMKPAPAPAGPAPAPAPVQYTAPVPAPARYTPSAASPAPSQYTLPALAQAPAPVRYIPSNAAPAPAQYTYPALAPAPAPARYTPSATAPGAFGAMKPAPAPARYTPSAAAPAPAQYTFPPPAPAHHPPPFLPVTSPTPSAKKAKAKKPAGQILLFAARRIHNTDNTCGLVLVHPSTGRRFLQPETTLEILCGIQFGDFMHAKLKDDVIPMDFKKMSCSHLPLSTKVINGDSVEYHKLKGTVKKVRDCTIVKNQHFANALVHEKVETGKECTFSIRLLPTPHILSTGEDFNFEAFNVEILGNEPAIVPKIQSVVPPSPSSPVELGQPASDVMRAFVESSKTIRSGVVVHHIWVCDIAQNGTFASRDEQLPIGSSSTINEVTNRLEYMSVHPTVFPISPNAAAQIPRYQSPSIPSLPQSLNCSVSSLDGSEPGSHRTRLLAMKRCANCDGSKCLVLVNPKSGERHNENETLLAGFHVKLGDFLSAEKENASLKNYLKTPNADFRFKVIVNGDEVVVNAIKADLIQLQNGPKVFRSHHFGYAFCDVPATKLGQYLIRLVLLASPIDHSGQTFQFKAIQWRPFIKNFKSSQLTRQSQNTPNQNQTQIQNPTPNQGGPKKPRSGFTEKKPSGTQKAAVIVGKGFTEKPKNAPIVGRGFPENPPQKSRAVVMSTKESDNGETTCFLWLLDEKAEGRFKSAAHRLQVGHFFEGEFKENKKRQFECLKYTKAFEEPLIPGGIEDGLIYLEVQGDKYQKRVNDKYATLQAEWIGEILDLDSMLTKKEGARVRIQRKGVAEKEYVWCISKVL